MNDLEEKMQRIVDVVVSSCITTIKVAGSELVSKEEILSKSKKQNAVKARIILAFALHRYGYTYTSISALLGCTRSAVSKMITKHSEFKRTNKTYLLACKSIKLYIEGTDDVS